MFTADEAHGDESSTQLGPPEFILTTRPVFPSHVNHPVLAVADFPITLRALRPSDLQALHELRSQHEVMKWTSIGQVDVDINATRTWMTRFIAMEESLDHAKTKSLPAKVEEASNSQPYFNFAIVYHENQHDSSQLGAREETVVGVAGCHRIEPEPECGYMIRQEYWGRGIASAALKVFLEAYWNLQRKSVKIEYDAKKHKLVREAASDAASNDMSEMLRTVPEALRATIEGKNIASKKVLEKSGFAYAYSEVVLDQHGRGEEELAYYTLTHPSVVSK